MVEFKNPICQMFTSETISLLHFESGNQRYKNDGLQLIETFLLQYKKCNIVHTAANIVDSALRLIVINPHLIDV